ncbi:MAG: MFS transporter [Gammaproteobacteria bacterium]|nr:MFS transporter [Gammaproteobacteria bacterium]MDH5304771.1 MFS transporter [Gammaproteobacteria bacterium]MDH5322404.1 MFS transporter [Gammaproteobacteria bacterium]
MLQKLFSNATQVRSNETAATLLSFGFVLCLMFAYNVMKPVRDAMAPDWSDAALAWLWTYNFIFSIVAVSAYGYAVSRVRLKYLIPGVYAFFATSFVLFYFGARSLQDTDLVNKSFYLWTSLFSLFHISVFWSLMSDLFTRQQAPRLFGFIASGASIGTIAGSALAFSLATIVGNLNLMLLAAVVLVALLPLVAILYRLKATRMPAAAGSASGDIEATVSGNPLAGFEAFVRSPFLLGIGVFIFLYTALGSFVYFEIKNLTVDMDNDARTQMWAGINLIINAISIVVAMFATGHIASRLGVAKTLAMVPMLVGAGFMIVVVNPLLAVVLGSWVVLKGGNYAITRPAREMLYTLVNREDRFKAKPVIDIVVYRGGDTLAAWAFAAMTAGLGFGIAAMAAAGAVLAMLWAIVGIYLGRRYDRTAAATDA